MRTLQEKYNAINEGNFSKDQFLRDARMQQPNLITQYNGYDDAVQILKNRGMIQEIASFAERFKEYSDDALTDIIINLSRYEGNEKDIEPVKAELARRKGSVDEISADTFKSAVDVAKGRGENQRASKLGSTFLNSFVGKLLMGGTISKIDIQKPSWGDYFDVTLEVLIPTQGTDGMYDKPKYLYYDVENDDWGMKGKGLEVTRQDARVLSQIAIKVNPDTKYRQGTQHFDIVGMNEARYGSDDPRSLEDIEKKITQLKDFSVSGYDRNISSNINILYSIYKDKGGKKTLSQIGGYGSDDPRSLEDLEKKLAQLKDFSVSGYDRNVSSNINLLYSIYKNKGGKKTLSQIAKTLNEARLNNKSLTDYRYKVTNDMDKYPYEQILRGLRVELEGLNVLGTPTPEEYKKALAKVLKNLEKDSIFYTNQVAGISKKVDQHDQMIDVKKDNTVDKFNGMKKAALKEATDPDIQELVLKLLKKNPSMSWTQGVKKVKEDLKKQNSDKDQLKEAIKGVIKNILSEGNEFGQGEDVYEMFSDEDEDDIPHPRGYEDQDEIDYDDENFSDPFIDGEDDLYETRKAQPLSELLK
jgi:hypothetical protein